ncbi:ChaN family lipoprotein, partial [Neptunomonas sp.]|uniref:ChaN family lipoprotein n=1 Tax=Neptunomonas sp. TaxID=1971898 RepID=UPI0035698AA5
MRTRRFIAIIRRLTIKPLLAGLLIMLLPAYASATNHWLAPLLQNHPLVGKIYSLEQQTFISEAELFSQLQKTPYVLVGEKHDNPDHHRLEEKILIALSSEAPAHIVFEMLTDEQQPLVSTLHPNDTLKQMYQKLQWNGKGWPWNDYGPLINTAVQQGASITAGNISSALLKKIYQQGSSAAELATARFNSMLSIPRMVREKILDQVYQSHCETMPKDQLTPMLNIQLARDASMAHAMISDVQTEETQRPSILIAGSFHTQKNIGVPLHLSQLTRQRIKTLRLTEVSETDENPEEYATSLEADYIWFTPKQLDIDYCAGLRAKTAR